MQKPPPSLPSVQSRQISVPLFVFLVTGCRGLSVANKISQLVHSPLRHESMRNVNKSVHSWLSLVLLWLRRLHALSLWGRNSFKRKQNASRLTHSHLSGTTSSRESSHVNKQVVDGGRISEQSRDQQKYVTSLSLRPNAYTSHIPAYKQTQVFPAHVRDRVSPL